MRYSVRPSFQSVTCMTNDRTASTKNRAAFAIHPFSGKGPLPFGDGLRARIMEADVLKPLKP